MLPKNKNIFLLITVFGIIGGALVYVILVHFLIQNVKISKEYFTITEFIPIINLNTSTINNAISTSLVDYFYGNIFISLNLSLCNEINEF